jgi:carboxyl-terminal processing protease
MRSTLKLGVVLMATALTTGTVSYAIGASTKNSDTYKQLNLFGDVFEQIRSDYVEPVTDEKLVEAAINGMLTSLDPHSSYMNEKVYRDMQVQTRGEFGGLGIEVGMENGVVKVISPIDDTPASRAGIKAGDYITHLDGEQIVGLSLNDAVEKMRGKPGSEVKLTVRRIDVAEPLEIQLKREQIRVQSVKYRVEGDNVGYIRISSFNEQTQPGLEKAIGEIKKQLGNKLQGYVLDLRNNPGGLLTQAISVSDTFLDKGEIVSTRGRHSDGVERVNAKPGDLANGLPIIVLINNGSASASEIVAGALQDHRRGLVLGTQSFGKGSVQTILELKNHGAMRLTTARYFTPSGRSIQAMGITPDIEVKPAKIEEIASALGGRREADLKGILTNPDQLKTDGKPTTPAAPPAGAPGEPGVGVTQPGKPGPQVKAAEPVDPKAEASLSAPSGTAKPAANASPAASGKGKTPEKTEVAEVDYQLSRALDLLRGVAMFQNRAVN